MRLETLVTAIALWTSACGTNTPAPPPAGDAGLTAATDASPATNASPAPSTTGPLPAQLKGYELYAWEEADDLWFTLITGTNRNKELAEVTTKGTNVVREDGWVVITAQGMERLKETLDRVPIKTPISLSTLAGLPALSQSQRQKIQLLLGERPHTDN